MSTVSNFIVADGEDEATWHVELEGGKEAAFQIRIHGIWIRIQVCRIRRVQSGS
jgi:hypothetical protein